MSKESYKRGFCKKAAENNIDPRALARFAVEKAAQEGAHKTSIWDNVLLAINSAKNKTRSAWNGLDPKTRERLKSNGLALGRFAVGYKIANMLAGKNGLNAASVLGGLGGIAANQVDWHSLASAAADASIKAKETTPGANTPKS